MIQWTHWKNVPLISTKLYNVSCQACSVECQSGNVLLHWLLYVLYRSSSEVNCLLSGA